MSETESAGPSTATYSKPSNDGAPCVLVLGMAGSGKSSFVQVCSWEISEFYNLVQRLTAHLHAKKSFPYVVNLDPAVAAVHYPANIDIRDTVNYKAVMRDYGLGPNGAIMTCLNLVCTRFDQVIIYKRFEFYNTDLDLGIVAKTRNHRAILYFRHSRTNRGVHLVSKRIYYHRFFGICSSNGYCLCC
jgi:hypothetical protein